MEDKLLPGLCVTPLRVGLASTHHPVPGVANCVLDLLPRGGGLTPMLVAIPAPPQIGLGLVPPSSQVMLGRLEAIAICGTKPVVVIRSQGVGAAGEVLVPVIVLGFPGSSPGLVLGR